MHQLLLMNTLETDSSIANSYEYLGAEHVRNRFPFSRYFNINTRQSGKSIQVVTHKLPLQNSAIFQSSTGSSSSRLSVIRVTTNQIRPRQHHRHPVLLYLLSIHYPALAITIELDKWLQRTSPAPQGGANDREPKRKRSSNGSRQIHLGEAKKGHQRNTWLSSGGSRVVGTTNSIRNGPNGDVKTTAMTCTHFPIHVYTDQARTCRSRLYIYIEGPCNFNINFNNIGHHMSPAVAVVLLFVVLVLVGCNFPKRHFEIIRFDSFSKVRGMTQLANLRVLRGARNSFPPRSSNSRCHFSVDREILIKFSYEYQLGRLIDHKSHDVGKFFNFVLLTTRKNPRPQNGFQKLN